MTTNTSHDATGQHVVGLGLGSNLGDRDAHLCAALRALSDVVHVQAVSQVYDTAPVHVQSQPRFHNMALVGTTWLSPRALLDAVKRVEHDLGRAPGVRYGPRVIDVDVLFYDDLCVDEQDLVIPHSRMHERQFVLAPLVEIGPDLRHARLGRTVAELYAMLPVADVHLAGPLPCVAG